MKQRRVAAVLYDFDHTLVDSPIDFAAMRRGVMALLADHGLEVPDAVGKLILEVVEEAASGLDVGAGTALRAAAEARIMAVELAAAVQAVAIPGVPASLHAIRAQGRRIGIITRNCREVVDRVLAQVPLTYDVLLTRDETSRVKPAPEHAWEALARLGVEPAEAILVGDFRGDLECAVAAGLLPVGVTTGRADAEELRAHGAAVVLASAADLPAWLTAAGW